MRKPVQWGGLLLLSLAFAAPVRAAKPPFATWNAGVTAEAEFQVQRIDSDSFVIRQSITTNFEAPFFYLLFGRTRALLLDSGAGGVAVRPTIYAIIADWCAKHNRTAIPLVVAHSHSHGDHHQGDGEFTGRADTTVVGLDPAAVAAFFGVADWPRPSAILILVGVFLISYQRLVMNPRTSWSSMRIADCCCRAIRFIPVGSMCRSTNFRPIRPA